MPKFPSLKTIKPIIAKIGHTNDGYVPFNTLREHFKIEEKSSNAFFEYLRDFVDRGKLTLDPEQKTWFGITKRKEKKRETESKNEGSNVANELIELSLERADFFHNQFKEPFAAIDVNDHREIVPLRSKQFRCWLAQQYWNAQRRAPYTEAIKTAINILEAKSIYENPQHELHNRIAWFEDAIWYDLADEKWRAVKITTDGWEVIERPPILFRRYAHQKSQVVPVKTSTDGLNRLFVFINLTDKNGRILVGTYLVTAFIPSIAHTMPDAWGPKGSGKTCFFWILRSLIDPSNLETLSLPQDKRELIQILAHHYAPYFDNVTHISNDISDILCRASTGEGQSKRELYSDDEDIIYSYRRCVGLNGINIAPQRPDLLDRSMLIQLAHIPKNKRKSERAIRAEFEATKPEILGAIFDALSATLKLGPVSIPELPRMADFTEWGEAASRSLGYEPDQFYKAYLENIGYQVSEAIEAHILGPPIFKFAERNPNGWTGTASELLQGLTPIADELGIRTQDRKSGWPKRPSTFSKCLRELVDNLGEVGIVVDFGRESGGAQRTISIFRKSSEMPSQPSQCHETCDGNYSSLGTFLKEQQGDQADHTCYRHKDRPAITNVPDEYKPGHVVWLCQECLSNSGDSDAK